MFEKTVNKTKAWKKLESHYKHFRKVEMKDLFACDADRAKKFSVNLEAMYVDYSKNRINDRTMKLLLNVQRRQNQCDRTPSRFAYCAAKPCQYADLR